MSKIHSYGLEVEFPSVSIDQLVKYTMRYAMVSVPQSCVYVAWKADDYEHNTFLHYLLSHFEEIGLACQGMVLECDLEPKGDRTGRTIYLCSFLDYDAEMILMKFMRAYCGSDYVIMRPWWVAKGLKVKGGK